MAKPYAPRVVVSHSHEDTKPSCLHAPVIRAVTAFLELHYRVTFTSDIQTGLLADAHEPLQEKLRNIIQDAAMTIGFVSANAKASGYVLLEWHTAAKKLRLIHLEPSEALPKGVAHLEPLFLQGTESDKKRDSISYVQRELRGLGLFPVRPPPLVVRSNSHPVGEGTVRLPQDCVIPLFEGDIDLLRVPTPRDLPTTRLVGDWLHDHLQVQFGPPTKLKLDLTALRLPWHWVFADARWHAAHEDFSLAFVTGLPRETLVQADGMERRWYGETLPSGWTHLVPQSAGAGESPPGPNPNPSPSLPGARSLMPVVWVVEDHAPWSRGDVAQACPHLVLLCMDPPYLRLAMFAAAARVVVVVPTVRRAHLETLVSAVLVPNRTPTEVCRELNLVFPDEPWMWLFCLDASADVPLFRETVP